MHDDEYTYYLAASYVRRHHARTLRDQIAIAAPKWRCTSRWLDWENSDPDYPVTTAAYDASDVLGAQALVFVAGPPYTPGKACELGLALAHAHPVYALAVGEEPDPAGETCIFIHLVTPILRAEEWLADAPFHDIVTKTGEAVARYQRLTSVTSGTRWHNPPGVKEDMT